MYTRTQEERNRAYTSLLALNTNKSRTLDLKLEIHVFDVLANLRDEGIQQAVRESRPYHTEGLCLVVGYTPEQPPTSPPVYFTPRGGEDIFGGKREPSDTIFHENIPRRLAAAMERDGVVLLDNDGNILHSGRYIDLCVTEAFNNHPYSEQTHTLINSNLKNTEGAGPDAGTRHLNCIAASSLIDSLRFYVLKSDAPQIRIISGGYVVHSTDPRDENHPSHAQPVIHPPVSIGTASPPPPVDIVFN